MIINTKSASTEKYAALVKSAISGEKKYYYVITFGCQQNEADSEKIRALAELMGYLPASSAEEADLIAVNTCAIREHAEMKALSLLGSFKAIKRRRPDLIVGICGCMAAEPHIAEKLKKDFHYVSFTVEPNMLHRIPELVYKSISLRQRSFICGEDRGDIVEGISPVRQSGHKAWVSVMYGCNNFCSYCIVPYVRGRERSRRSADIIAECRELISAGVKEITLLGQNVNSYRSDIGFPELLEKIAEISGDFLIRFMTSHPKDTSDNLISVMARHKDKIAPYFHLPLQSGSNSILSGMNRTYTREKFLEIVNKLRESIPEIALSTDVIVGFPGESDRDFLDTMEILEKVKFDMVYAFIYSAREGTRAAGFENQVPKELASARLSHLLSVQDPISLMQNEKYVGKSERVLVESRSDDSGVYTGRTPSNKLVHFEAEHADIGSFVSVEINEARPFDLIGRAHK